MAARADGAPVSEYQEVIASPRRSREGEPQVGVTLMEADTLHEERRRGEERTGAHLRSRRTEGTGATLMQPAAYEAQRDPGARPEGRGDVEPSTGHPPTAVDQQRRRSARLLAHA